MNAALAVAHERPRSALAPARGGLYATLLGRAVDDVAPQIAALHCSSGDTDATALLTIGARRGVVLGVLARVTRLPQAGSVELTRLRICRNAEGEAWVRTFGDRPSVTSWQHGVEGLLCERFGVLEFRFVVAVRHGGLCFLQSSAAIVLAHRRLILPTSLAPRIRATVEPSADAPIVRVSVDLPFLGRLLSYSGPVVRQAAR